jgi:hypothetical protein
MMKALGCGVAIALLWASQAPAASVSRSGAACGRVFAFSGYHWCALRGTQDDPEDPDRFSDAPANVFVDSAGRLHLAITRRNGTWYSAEVENLTSLGYGRYEFDIQGAIGALDPNVVAGLFTWSDDPSYNDREFDFEFSRWGSMHQVNAQFAVQPYQSPYHLVRFEVAPSLTKTTSWFDWEAGSIDFAVYGAEKARRTVVRSRLTHDIPPPGGDVRVHINVWLRANLAPKKGRGVELIFDRFVFTRSR